MRIAVRRFRQLALLASAALVLSGLATDASVAAGGPRVLAEKQLSERIRDLTVYSPALHGKTTVRLLLPRQFAQQPNRRWPSVYLLHGCCDSYLSWTRSTDVERLSADTGALVVMPDGGKVGFYSDWLRGPGWETFHTRELPQLLTRVYRADDRRVVAGNSMGGLGALTYTARHPGLFRAAASFSGITHTRLTAGESQGYQDLIRSQGENPDNVWGDPGRDAQRWAAHNPFDLAAQLARVPLYISVGSGRPGPLDPAGTQPDQLETALRAENDAFRRRLNDLHAEATFHFYDPGTHTWPYWQRELHRAWPILTAALTEERNGGWVRSPATNFTSPAGDLCPFELRSTVLFDRVYVRTTSTFPNGSPRRQEYAGPLVVRLTDASTGRSIVRDLSGRAVATYARDGSHDFTLDGPVAIGFRPDDSLPRGYYVLRGHHTVHFAADGTRTMTRDRGREENTCRTLAAR